MAIRLLPRLAAMRPLARISQQAVLRAHTVRATQRCYAGQIADDVARADHTKTETTSVNQKATNDGDTKPRQTVTSMGPSNAKTQAMSLIDALPSNNIVTKTGMVTAGVGAVTWLVSKEIYIFTEDSVIMTCFLIILYLGIKYASGPLQQSILDRNNHIWRILQEARDGHRSFVQSRINEVNRMSDIVDVTKNLFEMSKDMAKLEAQAFELQQKMALSNEIKAVLDSWVRHETAVRQREQFEIAQTVIERVRKSLTDPKVQDQILQQAVADVERLVAAK